MLSKIWACYREVTKSESEPIDSSCIPSEEKSCCTGSHCLSPPKFGSTSHCPELSFGKHQSFQGQGRAAIGRERGRTDVHKDWFSMSDLRQNCQEPLDFGSNICSSAAFEDQAGVPVPCAPLRAAPPVPSPSCVTYGALRILSPPHMAEEAGNDQIQMTRKNISWRGKLSIFSQVFFPGV